MNPTVVILSAGSSKEKMPGFPVFKTSPAFLPVNSRSLGKLVIDFYLNENIKKVYLVVNQDDIHAATEEFGCYGESIQLLGVTNSSSVVETVEKVLPQIIESDLIFNIVTTLPKILIPNKNCIGLNEKKTEIEGWAGVNINNNELTFISKKDSKGQIGYSFSGIFRADKSDILLALNNIQGEFRRDLVSLISNLHKNKKMDVIHFSWSDCGHAQNYFKTRTRIFGSRFFNSISLNTSEGIITKSSSKKEKLKKEIDFVNSLPGDLAVYFPRIIKVVEDGAISNVEMEYYAYPTLAEIMLYWDLPQSIWLDIFKNISYTLNKFATFKGNYKSGDWFEMYVLKIRERIAEFKKQLSSEELIQLFPENTLIINNKKQLSWSKIDDFLETVFKEIENPEHCSIIHGDYCFNNILCEPYVGLLKFLDPRGSFGEKAQGIYGDHKYDWAKLAHSVVGRYDYIVNDLFKVNYENDVFTLKTFDRPWQAKLDELYWNELSSANMNPNLIKFIVGTLFISMPPLHAENKKRQIAFFLKGIEFLNEGLLSLGFIKK